MRRGGALLLLALLVSTLPACSSGGPAAFAPFTAADAHFRASFPGKPRRTDQPVPSSAGPLRLVQYAASADGADYSVGWFRLATAPAGSDAAALLEGLKAASVAAVKGREVSSTTSATLDGRPAIEYTVAAPKGQYVHCITGLFGADVYVVQVVDDRREPRRYDAFTASFHALGG